MPDDNEKKIAELEKLRADRRTAIGKARDEQYLKDLERVNELEIEHGDDRVSVLKMASFVPGLPTLVVVRTPEAGVFNRFRQMVRKAGENREAMGAAKDLIAASCVLYPDEVTYARMKQSWPSIHDNVGIEVIRLGESEGKA